VKWLEICIHTSNEAIEPVSNILNELGTSGVVVKNSLDLLKDRKTTLGEMFELNPRDYPTEGAYIKTYIPDNIKSESTISKIRDSIIDLQQFDINIGKNEITVDAVDEEEWSTAWKKYYKPVQVSDKITIRPTWEEYKPSKEDELIIQLDPGMAFGTGTHPTTKLSLIALEQSIQTDDLIIDVGCGSGVLSIASVLLGAKQVQAYDLDDVAVNSTKINSELNHAEHKIIATKNDLLKDIHNTQADIIVSNILAEIIVKLSTDAWHNLKMGGLFITSGIIEDKKDLVMDDLLEKGFDIMKVNDMDGWVSIIAKKVRKE